MKLLVNYNLLLKITFCTRYSSSKNIKTFFVQILLFTFYFKLKLSVYIYSNINAILVLIYYCLRQKEKRSNTSIKGQLVKKYWDLLLYL